MIKSVVIALIIGLFSPYLGFAAGPAVLVEEMLPQGSTARKQPASRWMQNEKPVSQSESLKEIYTDQEFNTASEMRARRRVGAGFTTMGQVGLAGVSVELNFAADDSFLTSFGGGPKYNAFAIEWKHLFGGQAISPYATVGFAHWYNSNNKGGSLSRTTPEFLAGKYLSEDEKATGVFTKDFFTPSVGLQYNQLHGPYVGTAIFVEVVLMMEISDLNPVPTGSLGALYYF